MANLLIKLLYFFMNKKDSLLLKLLLISKFGIQEVCNFLSHVNGRLGVSIVI